MFSINGNETQRTLVAMVAALVLSTACVGAAVGPARAAEVGAVQFASATATVASQAVA